MVEGARLRGRGGQLNALPAPLSRVVSFGGVSVRLEYADGRAAEIVDFLFGAVPEDPSIEPYVDFQLRENPTDGEFELICDGDLRSRDASTGIIARDLLALASFMLVSASRRGMVFHAAALAWNDCGVLLPGRSGAGKTTVSAYLATRGFTHLGDDLSYVAEGTSTVAALARPLKIKAAGVDVLKPHLPMGERHTMAIPNEVLVAANTSADDEPRAAVPLSAIVFPRYAKGSRFRLEPMSRAQAGFALMEGLLNARNLSGHGFRDVTRLVESISTYSMSFGSLEQVSQNLEALRALSVSHPPRPAAIAATATMG